MSSHNLTEGPLSDTSHEDDTGIKIFELTIWLTHMINFMWARYIIMMLDKSILTDSYPFIPVLNS